MTTDSSRSERINLRATADELVALRQAASLSGSTLTAFILSTAVREAQSLIADLGGVYSPKELS